MRPPPSPFPCSRRLHVEMAPDPRWQLESASAAGFLPALALASALLWLSPGRWRRALVAGLPSALAWGLAWLAGRTAGPSVRELGPLSRLPLASA
jgi:hypothetical protein